MNIGLKKLLLQQKYSNFKYIYILKFILIQTAEEIREHTIPENLSPVAKTLAMLEYD